MLFVGEMELEVVGEFAECGQESQVPLDVVRLELVVQGHQARLPQRAFEVESFFEEIIHSLVADLYAQFVFQ
jgi:hypothetical protein